jgi:hypothetical protein
MTTATKSNTQIHRRGLPDPGAGLQGPFECPIVDALAIRLRNLWRSASEENGVVVPGFFDTTLKLCGRHGHRSRGRRGGECGEVASTVRTGPCTSGPRSCKSTPSSLALPPAQYAIAKQLCGTRVAVDFTLSKDGAQVTGNVLSQVPPPRRRCTFSPGETTQQVLFDLLLAAAQGGGRKLQKTTTFRFRDFYFRALRSLVVLSFP